MSRPTYQPDIKHSSAFNYGGRLVCGTSGLGGVWGEIIAEESVTAILSALERGVRAFDTAPSYANAETFLGMALKEWSGERPFISTKIGRQRGEDAFDFKLDYSDSALERSLQQSLKLLGCEKIDLLFLHEPQLVPTNEIGRILESLHRFRSQGLVDYIGLGGNPTTHFHKFIQQGHFDAISGFLKLNACNLSALDSDIPQYCQAGVIYYAASPLHFGLLGNRFKEYTCSDIDESWMSKNDVEKATQINEIANQAGMTLSSLAQRYLFSIAEADRVVVGARNPKEIALTMSDWEAGALPESLFDTITNILIT